MAGVTLRPFRPGDEVAVNEGFNRVFGRNRTLDEWAWKFAAEPEGRWIMLAVAEDGEVLAHYAAIPVRMLVGGLGIRAGQPVDSFSLPEARRGLAAGRMFGRVVEAFFEWFGSPDRLALLFGFPGERHLRLGTARLGYDHMPPQPVAYWVRPVDVRRKLRTGHEVQQGFDSGAIDELWSRSATRYGLAAVRDGAWLRRRFTGRPGVAYVHLSSWRRGRAHAWAVVRVYEQAAAWAELVWDGEDPRALAALDRAAVSLARGSGVRTLEMWLDGDGSAAAAFTDLGWVRGMQPEGLVMVARSFDPCIDVATFPGRFYLTMSDADLA